MQRIGVIGGGGWGTALAVTAARAGRDVLLWDRDPQVAVGISAQRRNPKYLRDIDLPSTVNAVRMLAELGVCDAVLLVTPAQTLRTVTAQAALSKTIPIVVCAKGIEQETGQLLHEVLADVAPDNPCALLSGPTFAREVAQGLPTAVSLGCTDARLGTRLTETLGSSAFRPYANPDVVGVQVGGAIKNVMAIACGIIEGRRLGENARAALVARGLAEMTRLAVALGGRETTLMGLSGLGDLSLSCFSRTSRNYDFGVRLGGGEPLSELLQAATVVEGAPTAAAVMRRAAGLGVDLPVCAAVDAVLHHGADMDQTIHGLLARPFRTETNEDTS